MNVKRVLVISLFAVSLPVAAKDINIQPLNQSDFHALSEDLGAALSYKPLTPTAPLGITGFDVGIAVTDTKLQNSAVFAKAGADISNAAVPSLRVHKGLPFGIDVGVMVGAVPRTNIKLYGGELRYAIVSGGLAMQAIGVRGIDTKGLDLSISKGFLMFTPYAGVGRVWASSTPNGVPALSKESLSLNKVFVGATLNFGLMNLAFEGDRTGKASSYGAKLGF